MRRPLRKLIPFLNFLPVVAILAGFTWFTFETANPLQRVEKEPLAVGRVVPSPDLERLAPLTTYVALHRGTGDAPRLPQFAVDEALAADDGTFSLRADETDGNVFFVFVRIEGADFTTYCARQRLPRVRVGRDGLWEREEGGDVRRLRIEVGSAGRCAPA